MPDFRALLAEAQENVMIRHQVDDTTGAHDPLVCLACRVSAALAEPAELTIDLSQSTFVCPQCDSAYVNGEPMDWEVLIKWLRRHTGHSGVKVRGN